jgi:hypothetical protein
LRFYVKFHGDKISLYDVVELEQSDADSDPFFTPGKIRQDGERTYNDRMDLFEPLMSELKRTSRRGSLKGPILL